jgi:uncharacterized protein YjiS (DUF1127 family)
MRNIRHVPAFVATHYGTDFPTVFRRATLSTLHVWGSAIRLWFERSRQRRALAGLDDRLLRDIGATVALGRREAAKPFWSASKA